MSKLLLLLLKTCSFFCCVLEVPLSESTWQLCYFLPGFMPLTGAWMGCHRKHGAVIKPLPRQEVSHRKDTLIYTLIMFLSLPSQTDLNWHEYSVSCSRLNKNLSTTSFQESERFFSTTPRRAADTDGEQIFFWSTEDGVWFLQNFLVLNRGNMLFGCDAIGFVLVVFAGGSSHTDWWWSDSLVARGWKSTKHFCLKF